MPIKRGRPPWDALCDCSHHYVCHTPCGVCGCRKFNRINEEAQKRRSEFRLLKDDPAGVQRGVAAEVNRGYNPGEEGERNGDSPEVPGDRRPGPDH